MQSICVYPKVVVSRITCIASLPNDYCLVHGVHDVDPDKTPTYNMSTPLPGEIQTNNRAEIYAILITVQNIELAGKIDFFTDNKIAKDTYNKGKDRARLANHADRWSEIFRHIEENIHRPLCILDSKSHRQTPRKERESTLLDERVACQGQ